GFYLGGIDYDQWQRFGPLVLISRQEVPAKSIWCARLHDMLKSIFPGVFQRDSPVKTRNMYGDHQIQQISIKHFADNRREAVISKKTFRRGGRTLRKIAGLVQKSLRIVKAQPQTAPGYPRHGVNRLFKVDIVFGQPPLQTVQENGGIRPGSQCAPFGADEY